MQMTELQTLFTLVVHIKNEKMTPLVYHSLIRFAVLFSRLNKLSNEVLLDMFCYNSIRATNTAKNRLSSVGNEFPIPAKMYAR